jgi:hypothetical protein
MVLVSDICPSSGNENKQILWKSGVILVFLFSSSGELDGCCSETFVQKKKSLSELLDQ